MLLFFKTIFHERWAVPSRVCGRLSPSRQRDCLRRLQALPAWIRLRPNLPCSVAPERACKSERDKLLSLYSNSLYLLYIAEITKLYKKFYNDIINNHINDSTNDDAENDNPNNEMMVKIIFIITILITVTSDNRKNEN